MSGPPPPPFPDWNHHQFSRFSRFGRFGYGGPMGYHRGFGLFRRLFWLGLGAGVYAFWSSRHQEYERYRRIEGGASGTEREEGCGWRSGWGCHRRRERENVQPQAQPQWQQRSSTPVAHHQPYDDEKQRAAPTAPPPFKPQSQPHTITWTYKDGHWTSSSAAPAQTTDGREASPVAPAVEASNDKGTWLPWGGSMRPSESAPVAPQPVNEVQRAPESPHAQFPSPADKAREVRRQAGEAMADISDAALDSLLTNIQALKAKLADARQRQGEHPTAERPTDSKSGFGPGSGGPTTSGKCSCDS